jgi:hypothetical protein
MENVTDIKPKLYSMPKYSAMIDLVEKFVGYIRGTAVNSLSSSNSTDSAIEKEFDDIISV